MSRFINNLKRRVAKEQKKIVLPESESRRVLQAAERVQAEGFARPILIGRPQSIVEVASEYQIDMDGIEIIDPETYPMMDKFCEYYAKRRAKKGMTLEEARKVLSENYIFFAACLVAFDIADGMVAVNGETCTMRGRKIRPGDEVTFAGHTLHVQGAQ